jgi:hypothetical protein
MSIGKNTDRAKTLMLIAFSSLQKDTTYSFIKILSLEK